MTFGSPNNEARRHTYIPGPGHCVAGIYTSKNHLKSKVSNVFFIRVSNARSNGDTNACHRIRLNG